MKFQSSILEYLGRINNGILVLISIIYNDEYYECTFYYSPTEFIFTTSLELDSALEKPINLDEDYALLIKDIFSKVSPYDEILESLEEIKI